MLFNVYRSLLVQYIERLFQEAKHGVDMKPTEDHHFPTFSDCEAFLRKSVGLSKDAQQAIYSPTYISFLRINLLHYGSCSIDEVINGHDLNDLNTTAETVFASIDSEVNTLLDSNDSFIIELAKDCGHRLDVIDTALEEHISSDSVTAAEYLTAKRSAHVIKAIFFHITARVEHEEEHHPLKAHIKSKLNQIIAVTTKVDRHLEKMLGLVDTLHLRPSAWSWIPLLFVLGFGCTYIYFFFALDEEHSVFDYILYFFGMK